MQLQNVEHLAEIEPLERSKDIKQSVAKIGGNSEARVKGGGSEWESNPPRTLLMPLNGFEARGAHRDPFAPLYGPDRSSINHPAPRRKSQAP
jgi:hypothetical protein